AAKAGTAAGIGVTFRGYAAVRTSVATTRVPAVRGAARRAPRPPHAAPELRAVRHTPGTIRHTPGTVRHTPRTVRHTPRRHGGGATRVCGPVVLVPSTFCPQPGFSPSNHGIDEDDGVARRETASSTGDQVRG
ncbi:hypothetical protein, partial [Microbacterium jejuense]|uniref:hypothetical protein n=1 Tax=Microbacterium jejuense TaxID=1263637 RepID=UPI0031EBB1CC